MEEINLEELSFEKDDLLNRRQIAVNLTNIIKNKSNLNVLAIDSSWGTGKTTFINKWIDMLNNDANYKDQFSSLYFNAWKNDYIKDPFMALMTEIKLSTSSDFKEAFKNAMTVGEKICKSTLNVSLKLATAGALGIKDIVDDELKNSVLKCIIDEKNNREEFIENLESLACEDKKIIFFIDEIDRCRPTFAIELLEVIKHLFSAKNIFFVISLDKEQLSHSIKTIYGENMDSQGYLRRFFDLEYLLPNYQLKTFIDFKFKELDTNLINLKYIKTFLTEIFTIENYTLRDIEKAVPFIELLLLNVDCFTKNPEGAKWNECYLLVTSYLYSFIIDLKIKHPSLLKDLLNCNYEDNSSGFSRFKKFDLEKFNLTSYGFSDELAKSVLKDVLDMFLKLNLLVSKTSIENVISTQDARYIVGKKFGNSSDYDWGCSVDLTTYFKDENIIEKLYFTEQFSIS